MIVMRCLAGPRRPARAAPAGPRWGRPPAGRRWFPWRAARGLRPASSTSRPVAGCGQRALDQVAAPQRLGGHPDGRPRSRPAPPGGSCRRHYGRRRPGPRLPAAGRGPRWHGRTAPGGLRGFRRRSPGEAAALVDWHARTVDQRWGNLGVLPRLKAGDSSYYADLEQQLRFAVHGPGYPVASPPSVPRRDQWKPHSLRPWAKPQAVA